MTEQRPQPGWTWVCGCGFQTGTHPGRLAIDQLRDSHLTWHQQQRRQEERRTA